MKRLEDCVKDCEASLELDQGCLAAMLQRAKCHMENKEWEQVEILQIQVVPFLRNGKYQRNERQSCS